jgi:DNA polymerase elongation subunit (family B)
MYRNIAYDGNKGVIHLWTWDEYGERLKVETSYEPSLYVESASHTDALSIFNTNLKKITFKNNFYRNKFVNETPIKRLFQNLNIEQDFLINNFRDDKKTIDYSSFPLRIYFWDIETYSPDQFPEPSEAKDTINLITLYDTLTKKYFSWGLDKFKSKNNNEIYIHCDDEHSLLDKFLSFWEENPPDIMCGWNSETFDVPYLINRIKNLMGDEEYLRLSPIKNVYKREGVVINKYNKPYDKWYISGVSNLDYMIIYKAFSRGDSESYSLNYIAEKELKEGKIDFGSGNLASLSKSDWDLFVKYNIQDVRLLVKLDETLKYLNLVRILSYKGFIPFEKATGKVSMITGAIAHEALLQGKMIPTFKSENEKKEYVGGYVHEPERGLRESLVSYDANSLYPNTIISLNISPETKLGKIISKENDDFFIELVNGKTISLQKEKFEKFIQKEKICVTDYDVLYTQKFKGVVPAFIDKLYSERVKTKNKISEIQKNLKNIKDIDLKNKDIQKIQDLDTEQNVYKLVLNSIYGTFAQRFSPLYDIDHSASVTLTGQSVIKKASDIAYEYVKDSGYICEKKDIYIYSDTDSLFLTIEPLLKHYKTRLLDDTGELSHISKEIIQKIDDKLNTEIILWSNKKHNSIDPRFVFKRETICDKGLFLEKKMYILHVIDKEGYKPKNPFIYKGVELAKSIMSNEVKTLIKNVVESVILSENKQDSDKIFMDSYKEFLNMDVSSISVRKKVNDIEKYETKTKGFSTPKGTPSHVKASIYYNKLLQEYNIQNIYEKVTNGNKIKIFYLCKNKYNIGIISFNEIFPTEFISDIKPDYEKMFNKTVFPPLERIYNCIGWSSPSLKCNYTTDLSKLFSEDDENNS